MQPATAAAPTQRLYIYVWRNGEEPLTCGRAKTSSSNARTDGYPTKNTTGPTEAQSGGALPHHPHAPTCQAESSCDRMSMQAGLQHTPKPAAVCLHPENRRSGKPVRGKTTDETLTKTRWCFHSTPSLNAGEPCTRNTASNPAMPQGEGLPQCHGCCNRSPLSPWVICKQELPRAGQNAAHHTVAHCMSVRDSCCKHTSLRARVQ